MVPEIILILLVFLLQAAGQLLIWLYWLQIKEYRFDRFFILLKSPDGVRELLLIPISLKFLIIFISYKIYIPLFFYLIDILFLATYFTVLFLTRKLRKPVFTKRVFIIILITIILLFLTIPIYFMNFLVFLLFLEIMLLAGPIIGIVITGFSVKKTLEYEKKIAFKKLRECSPIVIAVTGSYGKTTTKDFITQILSSKYKVLSTFRNQNTHFGIIRRIITDLNKNHKFFVVEIGAYKKGEIKEIAELLKPNAAVITGLEPQHLELFGSFENLKQAKFELVEALGGKGSAFFNFTNPEVGNLKKGAHRLGKDIKAYTYAVDKKGRFDAVSNIEKTDQNAITFKIAIDNKTKEIRTNIFSKRLIENLTGAILVARKYGVEWTRIIDVCKKLELPEGTLNIFKTKSGLTVIDDSYNATPYGFEAAIELLSQTEGKKKLVATTGIIELGSESYVVHKRLGKLLDTVCDAVLLRNKEFLPALKDGVHDKYKIRLMTDSKKIIDFIDKKANSESVVLIEGKLTQVVDYFRKI